MDNALIVLFWILVLGTALLFTVMYMKDKIMIHNGVEGQIHGYGKIFCTMLIPAGFIWIVVFWLFSGIIKAVGDYIGYIAIAVVAYILYKLAPEDKPKDISDELWEKYQENCVKRQSDSGTTNYLALVDTVKYIENELKDPNLDKEDRKTWEKRLKDSKKEIAEIEEYKTVVEAAIERKKQNN